ncbi:MucBP domain-containing protein, partial [Lactococcus muris]
MRKWLWRILFLSIFLFQINPIVFAQEATMNNNIDSSNGGVNITPLGTEVKKEGSQEYVIYSYQVSINSMISSTHLQTWNSFLISVPKFANDVKFTLIGTQDDDNGVFSAKDVNVPLGIQSEDEYYKDFSDHSIPTYEHIQQLLKSGETIISNRIVKLNDDTNEASTTGIFGVSQYGIVSNISKPIGIRVDIMIEKSRAVPYLAVDARLMWRQYDESTSYSNDSFGAQSLEDYRNYFTNRSWSYVAQPEKIKKGDFDFDGLHVVSDVAITKNTSSWSVIGRDVSPGINFVRLFSLNANQRIYYVASPYEDYADVAVAEYIGDGSVIVHYQDEEGRPLSQDIHLTGEVNTPYESEQKVFEGYEFKELKGQSVGVYTAKPQEITYVYKKIPKLIGNVVVHYQDEEGKPLSQDIHLTGEVNTPYESEQKVFEGYEF